ncbi:hypothetical protein CASFOL_002435 [Castilleja foliolosa]|uniref:Uncharacterized protein n=1 Tax=Castilleja foliolosa TaxID=1961234 RepID=A0ABD3EEU7_9LAMI
MEKTKQSKLAKQSSADVISNDVIWDCGSSLYDSFELKALEKLLDSAIVSKSLSMPHLSSTSHRRHPPPPPPPSLSSSAFRRLIRAVFRKPTKRRVNVSDEGINDNDVVCERSPALSTVPEVIGFHGFC